MGESEPNNKQFDGLELLYKDATNNIRLYKQQQFVITNYAILLYVAIVALHERFLLNFQVKLNDLEKGILSAVSIVVLIVGSTLIFRLHGNMVGCRRRMEKIRESFDDASMNAWKTYDKPDHASRLHDLDIPVTLMGVLVLGSITVWWVIYR